MARLKVRVGQAEAEVEADKEHLREVIELIPELISKLPPQGQRQPSAEAPPLPAPDPYRSPGVADIPAISVDKSDSLADIIAKFFADPWGRERRKLSDVRAALQSYGLNYPKQSVAVALLRLAKTTKIRRFKAEDGEYVYTASAVAVATPP